MRHLAFWFLLTASLVGAQDFSFGVKGGGLFTDPAERSDRSKCYVVGPSVEIGFPHRFAVEVNALYTRFGSSGLGTGGAIRGHMAELPVLGKYYFTDRGTAVRPYASAGFSLRNIWLERVRRNSDVPSTEPGVGAVAAAGVAFTLGPLKLAPEVRYTRWGGFNFPATNPNQVQGLLGVTF